MRLHIRAHEIRMAIKRLRDFRRRRQDKLRYVPPEYDIVDVLSSSSIVMDFGLGPDADFSTHLIQGYGLRVHGFDPTRKHASGLLRVVSRHNSLFVFYPYALSADSKRAPFYESRTQVSGALRTDHPNTRGLGAVAYEVQCVTLDDAMNLVDTNWVDLLKLDVEGAEYEVIDSLSRSTIDRVGQLIVEFHHHCLPSVTPEQTTDSVRRLKSFGFRAYTLDGVNYLFYRPSLPGRRAVAAEH